MNIFTGLNKKSAVNFSNVFTDMAVSLKGGSFNKDSSPLFYVSTGIDLFFSLFLFYKVFAIKTIINAFRGHFSVTTGLFKSMYEREAKAVIFQVIIKISIFIPCKSISLSNKFLLNKPCIYTI